MIRTASKDKSSGTAQHDEPERAHGVDNELEIVLKSGGAYCFAKKLNRASDDLERPSANLEGTGRPIPPDVGEEGAEEEKMGARLHEHRSRWFNWVPCVSGRSRKFVSRARSL